MENSPRGYGLVVKRIGGTMNEQQYYNLVFVKHDENDKKNYLFQAPLAIRLKAGDKVFVETIQGECLGNCVSDSFIVGEHGTASIMMGAGAYYPLKEVVGFAQKQEGYRCIDFSLPF